MTDIDAILGRFGKSPREVQPAAGSTSVQDLSVTTSRNDSPISPHLTPRQNSQPPRDAVPPPRTVAQHPDTPAPKQPNSDRYCGLFDDQPLAQSPHRDTPDVLTGDTAKGLTSIHGDATEAEQRSEGHRAAGGAAPSSAAAAAVHEPPDPLSPPAPAIPCPTCGSLLWWQSVYGPAPHCWGCEPPPLPAMVARRWTLRVLLDDEGRPLRARPTDSPGCTTDAVSAAPPPPHLPHLHNVAAPAGPTVSTPYLATWQRCGPDWTPSGPLPTSEAASGDDGDPGGDGAVLADFTADEPELEAIVCLDWWELISDDERRAITAPTLITGRGRCPWCKRRSSHTEACREMRREWGRMKIGKSHKGKALEDVLEDYLAWLLQNGVGSSDDRRMWLEELQGRERGHEFRTPYWERLVEV